MNLKGPTRIRTIAALKNSYRVGYSLTVLPFPKIHFARNTLTSNLPAGRYNKIHQDLGTKHHFFLSCLKEIVASMGDLETSEDIIPGLPDDLALRCLATISHGYHGLLASVCKRWTRVVRSTDYANLKAKEGWCGNWLFVFSYRAQLSQWTAYDPDADRWHPLPRFPNAKYAFKLGCSCVSVCKRLLVIGGCHDLPIRGIIATNNVMMFDPFKQQWSRVNSMHTERAKFACAVIHDKVYVAGGYNSSDFEGLSNAEVYDPHNDRWEDLPPMPLPLSHCFSISYGGQFHVVGNDAYVFFNPVEHKWHVVKDLWPYTKLSRVRIIVADEHIYSITNYKSVRVLNTDSRDWYELGTLPAVVLPGHARELMPFNCSLIGFKQYMYVLGGMVLKFDSANRSYDVVELDTLRFCDPTSTPLEWHDAKRMPAACSDIIGCALVEE